MFLGQTVRYTMNLKERLDLNFSSRSTYNIAQYSEQVKGNTQLPITVTLQKLPQLSQHSQPKKDLLLLQM